MAQIVRPGTASAGTAGQSCAAGQRGEGKTDVVMQQPGPRAGHQQRFADRAGEPLVTQPPVVLHGGHRGGVQREQPVLAELGVAHQQQPAPGVEVLIVEGDGFTAAHAGDREQADQGLHGSPAQRRLQLLRLGEQRGDVGGGIQVGYRPVGPAGQQAACGTGLPGREWRGRRRSRAPLLSASAASPGWRRPAVPPRPARRPRRIASPLPRCFQVGDELVQEAPAFGAPSSNPVAARRRSR